MSELIRAFTYDRNTFRRTAAESAESVAAHMQLVARQEELDKRSSNIVGALASYMGLFRRNESRFEATDLARSFLTLYDQNREDAWRWLLTRSLWRFVIPNGTSCAANAPAANAGMKFSFFRMLLELTTHLSAETGDKRFLYYEELCNLLDDDTHWTLSGAQLYSLLREARKNGNSGYGSKSDFLAVLEPKFQIPRDNFNGLFGKALAQTGFFEYMTYGVKDVAIAVRHDLSGILQNRIRYMLDNPVTWDPGGAVAWPDYLAIQANELPLEVSPKHEKGVPVRSTDLSGMGPLVEDAYGAFEVAGLRVQKNLLRRFVAALLAKRFVILTGLSGSGKTRVAQAFARWITAQTTTRDPFRKGAAVPSDRITYYVKDSDSLAVEFVNRTPDDKATRVVLPREMIREWADYVAQNQLGEDTPAREIREAVVPGSSFSSQLHSFETHLKAAAFALLQSQPETSFREHYLLLPVGADWTGNENVLGYPDGLKDNRYVTKPALELILRAEEEPEVPHFLILDEMNMSHVERYFADILSMIESGSGLTLYCDQKDEFGNPIKTRNVEPRIALPQNLYIIGTVNVDETTYMFSPKVLDRANVIEFRVDENELGDFLRSSITCDLTLLDGLGVSYGHSFVAASGGISALPAEIRSPFEEELLLFFDILRSHGMEFGFRVAAEAARFIYYYSQTGLGGEWFTDAMDAVVVQKLLPKLHGSRADLEGVLWSLSWACAGDRGELSPREFLARCLEAGESQNSAAYDPEELWSRLRAQNPTNPAAGARYPLSYGKVMRMLRKLVADQFASFAEA